MRARPSLIVISRCPNYFKRGALQSVRLGYNRTGDILSVLFLDWPCHPIFIHRILWVRFCILDLTFEKFVGCYSVYCRFAGACLTRCG